MTLATKVEALATAIGADIGDLTPSGRTTTAADTSTDADIGGVVILADTHTPTLHAVTDTGKLWQTITYFSDGATELTFLPGGTTMIGLAKINQYETVTATLTAIGAGAATVWRLTGGSA